jgi:hypothetical protein
LGHVRQNPIASSKSEPATHITKSRSVIASLWIAPGAVSGVNALARTTPAARLTADTLREIGMTPAQTDATLARLGPDASYADLDRAFSWHAAANAAEGGAPTSILDRFFRGRAATADDRIANVVSNNLGARPDMTMEENAIRDARTAASENYYKIARASPIPADVTPIMSDIDSQIPTASGSVKSVLRTVKSYLTDDAATATNSLGLTVPKGTSDGILGARQALDDLMYNRDTGEAKLGQNAMYVAGELRKQIDAVAKTDPLIAAGDAAYSEHSGVLDALKEGQDVFKPSTRAQDVVRSAVGKTPDELAAMQKGALGSLWERLDGAPGDWSTARTMFAKATANRAKAQALFPNAGNVLDEVQNEIEKRYTEAKVIGGSDTAARSAGSALFRPQPAASGSALPAIVGGLTGGPAAAVAGEVGREVFSNLRSTMANNALMRLRMGQARGMAGTPAERGDFADTVGRAYSAQPVENALSGPGAQGVNLLTRSAPNPGRQYFFGPNGPAVPTLNALSRFGMGGAAP